MNGYIVVVFSIVFSFTIISGAVIVDSDVILQQGLYYHKDGVVILGQKNFDKMVYGKNHVWLIEFYNTFCGHCQAFAPKYKSLARDVQQWKPVFQLAVVDCAVEENNQICRQFEILAYPSLRYLHENYSKGNANVGDQIHIVDTADKLKAQLITKMQSEQTNGRLQFLPSLSIASYASYVSALVDVPNDVIYTFLVFENVDSTVGSELILDTNDYENIRVKRVSNNSVLSEIAGISHYPSLVAVRSTLETTPLTPKNPTKQNLENAINIFLKSKKYTFPKRDLSPQKSDDDENLHRNLIHSDTVYYADLEKTIKTTLHTEVVRYKIIKEEALEALLDYLDMLIINFPFRANGKSFFSDLRRNVAMRKEWKGEELYDLITRLEQSHAPVYSTDLEYIACRGSGANYRGYTCGLWTLFHTLTVNSVNSPGIQGPKVLKALYGYVKYFFGCTECSEHFQSMAARNRIFDVDENDKAVLWLWIAHNEVNLRLAGEMTEDPLYPKIQFPSVDRCINCRLVRGAWDLKAVYQYLQQMYGAEYIQDKPSGASSAGPSPFSNADIGLLSFLYILSFVILILVIKLFLTKRFYRKRVYKHDGSDLWPDNTTFNKEENNVRTII